MAFGEDGGLDEEEVDGRIESLRSGGGEGKIVSVCLGFVVWGADLVVSFAINGRYGPYSSSPVAAHALVS